MAAIALKDESQNLAGFLLVSGDEPLGVTTGRDCIFMIPPSPFSSPAKDILSELKNQEFAVTMSTEGAGLRLSGSSAEGELFEAYLPTSGVGTWSLQYQKGVVKGQCELAKGQ
jgi:hypothetical protein